MRPVEKEVWIENNVEIDKQYSPYGNTSPINRNGTTI